MRVGKINWITRRMFELFQNYQKLFIDAHLPAQGFPPAEKLGNICTKIELTEIPLYI